jgi:thymidine kinase
MSLTLIIGPMFSGKTTALCEIIDRIMYTDQKCIMIG